MGQEELRSANEELQTVNEQLRVRIEEISHASDYLRNLMSSTDLATIFVDRDHRVKLFTPRARELFNVEPDDAGRPLSEIAHELLIGELTDEITLVLKRIETIEREVETRDGSWFLMRLVPYWTIDGRIDGVVLTFLDVTERHHAAEAIRASEARQAFLLRLSDALRPVSDPAEVQAIAMRVLGEHLRADRAFYGVVEADATAKSLVILRDYHVDDVPGLAGRHPLGDCEGWLPGARSGTTVIGDVAKDADLSECDRQFYRSLGLRAVVELPIVKSGRVCAIVGVHQMEARDWGPVDLALITETAERTWAAFERARAEEALRVSEARYRTLFESIDEGFVVVDVLYDGAGKPVDLFIVSANPAAVRMTGTSLAGRGFREVLAAAEPQWMETFARVAQTGSPERHEYSLAQLDAWYDFYVFKMPGAPQHRVAVLYEDITPRRRIEAALRESETRLHAIANLVPDLLWMSEPDGRTVWYNDRWLAFTGHARDREPIREWMEAVHPDDRQVAAESYRRAVEEQRPYLQEQRIRGADGEYRWFLVNSVPVRDERGRVIRYYGAATDVHEQRMAREDLEERVRERTKALIDLSVSRQRLLERIVSVTEEERRRIARELHDEMGQHLTALRVGLDAIQPQTGRLRDLKGIIDRIDRSIDRLATELRPPALDELGLYGAITSLADEFSAASGVRVAVHLGIGPEERFPEVRESTIYRVVQETLTNVWKHSGATTVSVIVERIGDALRLIVEDDGSGFDSADAMAAGSSGERVGILGMRERLELVGGTFEMESSRGSGTTVFVRVPLPKTEGPR